jgi:hypothetical protein
MKAVWGIPPQRNNRRIVESHVFFAVCSVELFSFRSDHRLYNEGRYELVEYIEQSWGIQLVEQKPVYRVYGVGVSVWNLEAMTKEYNGLESTVVYIRPGAVNQVTWITTPQQYVPTRHW